MPGCFLRELSGALSWNPVAGKMGERQLEARVGAVVMEKRQGLQMHPREERSPTLVLGWGIRK